MLFASNFGLLCNNNYMYNIYFDGYNIISYNTKDYVCSD